MTESELRAPGRKWWHAALLSFCVTGLGQVYNGEAKRGIWLYAAYLLPNFLIALGLAAGIDFSPLVLVLLAASVVVPVYALVDAIRSARRQADDFEPRPYNRTSTYILALMLSWFLVGPVIRGTLESRSIKAYYIPSAAMEGTLLVGDYLLADRSYDEPQVGDVVIYRSPSNPDRDLVKRCVAVGGQTVEIVDKVLRVDGEIVPGPPLAKHTDPRDLPATPSPRDNFGPYEIQPDYCFVMGDNRDNSNDSRFHGPIPTRRILGKAEVIYWSAELVTGPVDDGLPRPLADLVNTVWNLPSLPFRTRYGRLWSRIH